MGYIGPRVMAIIIEYLDDAAQLTQHDGAAWKIKECRRVLLDAAFSGVEVSAPTAETHVLAQAAE